MRRVLRGRQAVHSWRPRYRRHPGARRPRHGCSGRAGGTGPAGAGLAELAIGLALLAGAFTRAAAVAGFVARTLTLFGLPDDPVLAHVTLSG